MLFAKRSHIPNSLFFLSFDVLLLPFLLAYPSRSDGSVAVPLIGVPALIAATVVGLKYCNTFGLYVNGSVLIYKTFWKKRIDPQKIGAIKIARAVYHQQYSSDVPLINKKGEPLYSMILLKESDLWERTKTDAGDYTFRCAYGEYAFCICTYNQEIIDHLLTLNPNIYIF